VGQLIWSDLTYEDKLDMFKRDRAICQDVSGNLADKILAEAATFNHRIASKEKEKEMIGITVPRSEKMRTNH
jgi:hypothetical protein